MKTILEHLSHNSHSSSNSKVYFELQFKDGNSILLHLSRVICTIQKNHKIFRWILLTHTALQVLLAFLTSEQTHSRHYSRKSYNIDYLTSKREPAITNSYRTHKYHEKVTGFIRYVQRSANYKMLLGQLQKELTEKSRMQRSRKEQRNIHIIQ